ncbi:hypothetical protein KIW84_071929 [Lathyrus oleraceus]|uniref:Uncharacterized protein n=1 Tax=Pisum sativum TaxID=3888 RepID=A0A9D4VK23_PEA|nr:hypothetical protein KIW84_071929 [Pisum sativum]
MFGHDRLLRNFQKSMKGMVPGNIAYDFFNLELTDWVRVSRLPIEYYDARVLTFIRNHIGVTVKVDKNTMSKERGKYVRLCVQVDLTKPLLAMFAVTKSLYKIEYEGLHLLCLSYGCFGHFKEGCVDQVDHISKDVVMGRNNVLVDGGATTLIHGDKKDGPWTIMHKAISTRK